MSSQFSLKRVYVVPSGNSLPTTGRVDTLTARQFGVFNNQYIPAVTGSIATDPWIFFAQGRANADLNLGPIMSDKIYLKNVKSAYKITAEADVQASAVQVSNFTATCGEQNTIVVRLFSENINVSFRNGMTRAYVVDTPCCECGDSPCEELDGPATQALVDAYVAKINADKLANPYVGAARVGTGLTAVLVLTGKVLPVDTNPSNDPYNNVWEYDGVKVFAYANKGAYTTQDFSIEDACNTFATVTTLQEMTFPRGNSGQVKAIETANYSYKQGAFKVLFKDAAYNGLLNLNTVDGTYYDEYELICHDSDDEDWNRAFGKDFTVSVFFPAGGGTTFETLMTAFGISFVSKSGPNITTTISTTSTSTTSSTTTTTTP